MFLGGEGPRVSCPSVTQSDYFKNPEFAGHFKVMEVLRRWEPIGVIGDDSQDEYDSYSVDLMRMLDAGASVDDLVGAMREIVLGHMGMSAFDEAHARDCADELVQFWQSWKGGGTASPRRPGVLRRLVQFWKARKRG